MFTDKGAAVGPRMSAGVVAKPRTINRDIRFGIGRTTPEQRAKDVMVLARLNDINTFAYANIHKHMSVVALSDIGKAYIRLERPHWVKACTGEPNADRAVSLLCELYSWRNNRVVWRGEAAGAFARCIDPSIADEVIAIIMREENGPEILEFFTTPPQ